MTSRFSRGMSMPAMRAMRSALPLLVSGVVADDHHAAVPADDAALVADLLDAWSYLHVVPTRSLFVAPACRLGSSPAGPALGAEGRPVGSLVAIRDPTP